MEEKVYLHFDEKDNSFWFSMEIESNIIVSDKVVDILCGYSREKNIKFVSRRYDGDKLYLTEKNFADYFEEYEPQVEPLETPEQKRIRELEEALSSLKNMFVEMLDNKESR